MTRCEFVGLVPRLSMRMITCVQRSDRVQRTDGWVTERSRATADSLMWGSLRLVPIIPGGCATTPGFAGLSVIRCMLPKV